MFLSHRTQEAARQQVQRELTQAELSEVVGRRDVQPGPGDADGHVGRDGLSARNSQWTIPLLGMIA